MRRHWLFVLAVVLAASLAPALARAGADGTPKTMVRDGVTLTMAQERRAEVIGNKLRCLVCQNETVENSQASLAKQFRGIIRRRVVAGESDKQVIHFMVQRYGIFVLLKPPLIPLTALLWFSPLIAIVLGVLVLFLARRRSGKPPAPLSEQEQARLKELLH